MSAIAGLGGIPVGPIQGTNGVARTNAPEGGFGATLMDAIDRMDRVQTGTNEQVKELLEGRRDDLENVMIAVEKADVTFQLMMQVRNKIVNAYQEVSRMQF